MLEDVIFDTILWTTIIVGIWYWRREKKAITGILEDQGIDLEALAGNEGVAEDPLLALAEGDRVGASVPSLRILPTDLGDLRLEADVVLEGRTGEQAVVKLGVLRADGTPFPHPAAASWTRFEDGTDTLGGDRKTQPAARRYAYWHDLHVVVKRRDLGLADGPSTLKIRAEVWIDGTKVATGIESVRYEIGSRGPPEAGGDACVACGRGGAETHCPRCKSAHHDPCITLNRGCTVLRCAERLGEGYDPYRTGSPRS